MNVLLATSYQAGQATAPCAETRSKDDNWGPGGCRFLLTVGMLDGSRVDALKSLACVGDTGLDFRGSWMARDAQKQDAESAASQQNSLLIL